MPAFECMMDGGCRRDMAECRTAGCCLDNLRRLAGSAPYGNPGGDEWDADLIISRVRDKLKERSEFGLRKYGSPLSDRQDIGFPGWILHLQEELLDAANYCECIMHYGMGYYRHRRQQLLYEHGNRGFGKKYGTVEQRALRVAEEALETLQAAGLTKEQVMVSVDYVFSRKVGSLPTEVGQLGVTLLMLAEAAGFDAEGMEQQESTKFLLRDPEEMKARLKEKLSGGMPVAED